MGKDLYRGYAVVLSLEEPEAANGKCSICGCPDSNGNFLRWHLKKRVWHCEQCIESHKVTPNP